MSGKVATLVTPDSAEFADLQDTVDASEKAKASRVNYNEVAELYNQAPVGSFMVLEWTANVRKGNVIIILQGRGLRVPEDVEVTKPARNAAGVIPSKDRRVVIKKITNAQMGLVGK